MTLHVAVDARLIQWPGIGRYIGILLRGLAARPDVRVTALVAPEAAGAVPDGIATVRVTATPFSLAEQFQLQHAARSVAAEVFHTPHFNVPLFARTPVVATVHDAAPLRFPPEGFRGLSRRLYASLFYAATGMRTAAIITVSDFARRDISSAACIPHDKLTVVHLAMDPRFLALADAALTPGDKPSLAAGSAPYVLYVGTNKPWKNLEVAVRGAEVAAARVPGLRLVIAGKQAANQEPLSALLSRVAPTVPVEIIGTISDEELTRLYRDSLAMLCPSLYEGFGLTGLEAMACGAPVIHSGAASLPEVLGAAALRADPHQPTEWADAICRLFSDEALREERSRAGRERARTFSVDRMISETVAVYHHAVGGRSRTSHASSPV